MREYCGFAYSELSNLRPDRIVVPEDYISPLLVRLFECIIEYEYHNAEKKNVFSLLHTIQLQLV